MRYSAWVRLRRRPLTTLFVVILYLLLVGMDASYFLPKQAPDAISQFHAWLSFGFSTMVALFYLSIGSLVWLYGRNRVVAYFLFIFSCAIATAFTIQPAAAQEGFVPQLFTTISGISSAFALYMLFMLLLVFPRNHLLPSHAFDKSERMIRQISMVHLSRSLRFIYSFVLFMTLLLVLTFSYSLRDYSCGGCSTRTQDWLYSMSNIFEVLILLSSLFTIIFCIRGSSTRQRQQLRIFVSGIIVAIAPFFVLTILPRLLNLPARYMVDGQLSVITMVLLPLALGYSILRYQFLVFDRYIRRIVVWVLSAISLLIVVYVLIVLGSFLPWGIVYATCIALATVLLMIFLPRFAQVVTDRLFFSDFSHYRRFVANPELLSHERFDLAKAATLLSTAAIEAFEAPAVAVFVFDTQTGFYQPMPALNEEDPLDTSRYQLVQHFLAIHNLSLDAHISNQGDDGSSTLVPTDWISEHDVLIQRLSAAHRPLLLSEVCPLKDAPAAKGLARYLITESTPSGDNPLLVPIWAKSMLIGMLVLGERSNQELYAGPDFEAMQRIVTRFSPVLESVGTALQEQRHTAMLDTLTRLTTMPVHAYQSTAEMTNTYASVVADALGAHVEVWLTQQNNEVQMLQCSMQAGIGPCLTSQEQVGPLQEGDWISSFSEGSFLVPQNQDLVPVPSCVIPQPKVPFVWLPMQNESQQTGVLVLTYPRPHRFSEEERHLLELFANQCAAMENARSTIALRLAYEQQQEMDALKDQFIMTASHELRTPLTAIQGYIELLSENEYNLPAEIRTDFLKKASRGCHELVLMLGNMMDASRVNLNAKHVRLSEVPLASSVSHILEILEARVLHEHRTLDITIPEHLMVLADEISLQQVLLNLVSNAIKYSPVGTNIAVSVREAPEQMIICVRDRGFGVAPEEQSQLFARFVRLGRDMNSTVRGTGLGLYITKQLVEAMGGRVWVESTGIAGEGSTFAFTLKRSHVVEQLVTNTMDGVLSA